MSRQASWDTSHCPPQGKKEVPRNKGLLFKESDWDPKRDGTSAIEKTVFPDVTQIPFEARMELAQRVKRVCWTLKVSFFDQIPFEALMELAQRTGNVNSQKLEKPLLLSFFLFLYTDLLGGTD